MGKDGGTKIFCPHCQKITVCSSESFVRFNQSSQRWQSEKYEDLNWFERGRHCNDCYKGFTTVEMEEKFLKELIELRDLQKKIKRLSEECLGDSKQVTSALKKMVKLFITQLSVDIKDQ